MVLKSTRTQSNDLLSKIKSWIYEVFNHTIFGIYEGVIETYDTANAVASVRVVDLDNILVENCRCAYPAYGIRPYITSGIHVVLLFRAFSLEKPIILGYLPAEDNPVGFTENEIYIENGNASIQITNNAIRFNASIVTANGEDLTQDDEGSL